MEIENAEKILIIQLRRIGDVLLTTPVIEALRELFPKSRIDFLVEKPADEVLKGNPYLNNVIISDKGFFEQLKLILKIRKEKYTLIIDFLGNPRSAWITFFSRATYRAGFDFAGRKFAYNVRIKRDKLSKYVPNFKLDAIRSIGLNVSRKKMLFHIPQDIQLFMDQYLDKYLSKDKILVGMAPWSRRQARRWSGRYFAEIGDRLMEKYKAEVIMFWGPGEKEEIEKIVSLMKNKPVIAPPTNLKQLGALIKKCRLMVTNDNGLMHIAVSLGIPTVTMYGPTDSENWNPPQEKLHQAMKSDVACLVCNKQECIKMECMEKVTPDIVEKAIRKILAN
jgi:lipopolysaccharide heptosyltransferase II